MLPRPVEETVAGFVRVADRVAEGSLDAVYLVGGAAMGDFSLRQSNIDLVVVTETALSEEQRTLLLRAERGLIRAGRQPGLWYTTWDVIADGAPPGATGEGSRAAAASSSAESIDTPMTRALLREDAIALAGPDWPIVDYDEGSFRVWCRRRLDALASCGHGLMVMRRGVVPLVLEAARLAEGVVTGRLLSKSEAGDAATQLVPAHFRRILNDAAGYRRGANTSMYWGPFERKYDAKELLRHLAERAASG